MQSPTSDDKFGRSDKKFYDSELHYFDVGERENFAAHAAVVALNLGAVQAQINGLVERKGAPIDVLELGAGTCCASLQLRKTVAINRHVCSDISAIRMHSLIAKSASHLKSDAANIELVEADFTYALPFEDRSFDLVLFDGALHHSRNIWTTLNESRRILRPSGAVVAIREAMLGLATYKFALRRLLQSDEVRAGVAENIYLRDQYEYYFRANGFSPTFRPVYPDLRWRLLAPLNGILMSKWTIYAPSNQPCV
jgi:ubiquinone/menaquinone biosynthesis C-methylase UbiE